MKNTFVLSLATGCFCAAIAPQQAQADLLAAWDFAGLPATTTTTTTPATISAAAGLGLLDISEFNFLGSPIGTNPERTAFSGSSLNLFTGAESGGMALAIANSSANGKSLLFSFSMAGHQDLVVSFATRGTSTGFDSGIWSWSTDNLLFTTLPGVNTATRATSFSVATVDFSLVSQLDNASTVYLKYTLSGATSAAGNNRLDNIQLNAAVVPEPSVLSLACVGGLLGFLAIRRRS